MSIRCELCSSDLNHPLFEGKDRLYGLTVQTSIVQCDECGLIYLWPQPSRLSNFYPDKYAPYLGECAVNDIAYPIGRRKGLLSKAQVVLDNHPGILLDIGCAAGEFLATVHALNGRPVMGVDLNELAVRRAWQRFGVPVWVGSVPGLPLPDASIDVVTMWHVFEHLPYPLLALYDVARILREDGILVIACPMSDSWEARLFRRYWAGYDVPRHLFTYSRQTLPQMLRRAGFESFEVPGVVWGFNSAKISSAFWLQDIFPFFRYFPRLLRSIATLMGAGAALLFWVLSLIFCNHAAVAVFVARKRIDVEV